MVGDRLTTINLLDSVTEGAIVGEPTLPHAAVVVGSLQVLTTGTHTVSGQTGDMGAWPSSLVSSGCR